MNKDKTGFVIDIKKPTRKGYVACLVVRPKGPDGKADVSATVERNLGLEKSPQIAHELLAFCQASDELLAQVQALSKVGGKIRKA